MRSVASHGVERVVAERVGSGQVKRPAGGAAACQGFPRRDDMEATMRLLDSTSLVMVLIMAGVFAPVIVIHILATSVFQ
jgi:hypothetical protein